MVLYRVNFVWLHNNRTLDEDRIRALIFWSAMLGLIFLDKVCDGRTRLRHKAGDLPAGHDEMITFTLEGNRIINKMLYEK